MDNIKDKIKNTRILAVIGLVCLFLGLIFPYIKVDVLWVSMSITLIKYLEGKIIFTLIVLNAMFIFKDYVKKYVPKLFESEIGKKIESANPKMALIPVGLTLLCLIWMFSEMEIGLFDKGVSYSLGFWVEWIGMICIVVHTFMYKGEFSISNNNTTQTNNEVPQTSETTETSVEPTEQTSQNEDTTN